MKTTIAIQNLKCSGCAATIQNKISEVENISDVVVGVAESTVSFDYKSDADLLEATDTLLRIGYPSVDEKNTTTTKVKSYVSCAIGKIQK